MKTLTLFIFIFGFTLTTLSSAADDAIDDDDDNSIDDDDINYEDYIPLDDLEALKETFNGPRDNDFSDPVAEAENAELPETADENEARDLSKRKWEFKCEPKECINRCKILLSLPQGICGNGGKCYCRRILTNPK